MEFRLSHNLLNGRQDLIISEILSKIDKNLIQTLPSDNKVVIDVFNIILNNCLENQLKSGLILFGFVKSLSYSKLNCKTKEYLTAGDKVIAYISDESCILYLLNIVKDINNNIDNTIEFSINIDTSNTFIYNYDSLLKNINNELKIKITKYNEIILLIFSISFKLYVSYFQKYKANEHDSYCILSNNYSECLLTSEILKNNKFNIINNNNFESLDDIFDNSIDVMLDFSENIINNQNKKSIFKKLNFNSVIYTNSNKIQLDNPDIEFISDLCVHFNLCKLNSFIQFNKHVGKLINFLDNFMTKSLTIDFNVLSNKDLTNKTVEDIILNKILNIRIHQNSNDDDNNNSSNELNEIINYIIDYNDNINLCSNKKNIVNIEYDYIFIDIKK